MVKVVAQVEDPKRKRYNKNKKKAWRKKTKIKDVEESLEEERREERYGGPLEKRDVSELLFLDVGGKSAKKFKGKKGVLEYIIDTGSTPSKETPASKFGLKTSKRNHQVTVKSHQLLNGLPGVKPPVKSKPNQGIIQRKKKSQAQAKDPKFVKKVAQRKKNMKETRTKLATRATSTYGNKHEFDIWGADDYAFDDVAHECRKRGVEDSFVEGIAKHYRAARKLRALKETNATHKVTTKLAAVMIPHAGTSYNPTYEDHQKLLRKAVKQEDKFQKEELKLKRTLTDMFPTVDQAPTEATWIEEMSQGLPKDGDEEEEEDEKAQTNAKADTEEVTVTSRPVTERKTKQQRRKEKKQKTQEVKRLQKKEQNVRKNNLYRIKSLVKEVTEEQKVLKETMESRAARKKNEKLNTRRLGRVKFQAEDVAVNLGTELPDSLRNVVPANNIWESHYKHLQRRNIIEPRLKHKVVKKYKQKTGIKRTHREEMEKIEKMVDTLLEDDEC